MKKLFISILLGFSFYFVSAQYDGNERDTLDGNMIKAIIHPKATQFFEGPGSQYNSFFIPKDTTLSTLFTQSLWVGGMAEGDTLHFAGDRYSGDGHDFWSGPYCNPSSYAVANEYYKTWKITKAQINYHCQHFSDPYYNVPEAIETWPAHGIPSLGQAENLAEFVDYNNNNRYDPENGDYPLIKGDQAVFYLINDHREHTETGGRIMGIEIQCLVWIYNSETLGDAYDHSVFMSCKVINRSEKDYYHTYIGVFTDFDIGNASDDFIECNVEDGYFFAYNSDDYDIEYRDQIPMQASAILSGPFMDDDGLDNPDGQCNESINGSGFGDGEVDNERFGMSRFVYFNNEGGSATTDPRYAQDYYNYMKGFWKDGTAVLYGGNGHVNSGAMGPESRFVFPGDSDPCHWGTNGVEPVYENWTEESAYNPGGDRRGVASMGPFTFEAGSTEYIDLVLVTAPAIDKNEGKDLLDDYVSEIRGDYLHNPMGFGNYYVGIEESIEHNSFMNIHPNPIQGNLLYLELNENAAYQIFNTSGQLILSGNLTVDKPFEINVSNLISGAYILIVQTKKSLFQSKLLKL
jgi:hypothetical protein